MDWTQRILEFPVRAAAVDDFLRDLRSRRTADLNAVLSTLNEGGLCREAVRHWTENGWIMVAPNTPLLALPGPRFDRALTLTEFCGDVEILENPEPDDSESGAEDGEAHGDS
jgi:hypothetical protein